MTKQTCNGLDTLILKLNYAQVPWPLSSKRTQPSPPGVHAADADDATCQLPSLLRGDHSRRPAHPASHPTRSKHGGSWKRSRRKTRPPETRSRHGHRLLARAIGVLPGGGSGQASAGGDDRHEHDAQTGRKTGQT